MKTMSEDRELFNALSDVAEAAKEGDAEIDAARAALKATEAQVDGRIATLVANVARVVFELNSQALRQQAVRKLYWESRIKASIIAEAFRINDHAVYTTAGPLIAEVPCDGACGRTIEQIYRSHSDWKHRIPDLCSECEAQRKALGRVEYEKYVERQQAEAVAYCTQNGHYWGAENIDGKFAESGVDWISNNKPIRLENATLISIDTNSIVLQLRCMHWCGATIEKRISATSN
jgi:hypothetical protein